MNRIHTSQLYGVYLTLFCIHVLYIVLINKRLRFIGRKCIFLGSFHHLSYLKMLYGMFGRYKSFIYDADAFNL